MQKLLLISLTVCFLASCVSLPLATPMPVVSTPTSILSTLRPLEFSVLLNQIQGTSYPTEDYMDMEEPGAFVFADLTTAEAFTPKLSSEVLKILSTVNFDNNIAVLVTQGYKPSLGYGIDIIDVGLNASENIEIQTRFATPQYGHLDAVSSPYAIIVIPIDGLQDSHDSSSIKVTLSYVEETHAPN